MNAAYVHLALNHFPVLGAIFALGLLAWALRRGSDELLRTALGVLALVGVAGVAVYLTGESAEELVEGLAGVSHDRIEAHEEAALVATIVAGAVGLGAFAHLLLHRGRELPPWTGVLAVIAAVVTCGVFVWTASRGGTIRHPELREGFEAPEEEVSAGPLPAAPVSVSSHEA